MEMDMGYSVFPYLATEFLWVAFLGFLGHLAHRMVRAYERRWCLDPQQIDLLSNRVHRLEDSIEKIERANVEILEAQRFTTRLLSDRSGNASGRV